jgi:hypothetical protein
VRDTCPALAGGLVPRSRLEAKWSFLAVRAAYLACPRPPFQTAATPNSVVLWDECWGKMTGAKPRKPSHSGIQQPGSPGTHTTGLVHDAMECLGTSMYCQLPRQCHRRSLEGSGQSNARWIGHGSYKAERPYSANRGSLSHTNIQHCSNCHSYTFMQRRHLLCVPPFDPTPSSPIMLIVTPLLH